MKGSIALEAEIANNQHILALASQQSDVGNNLLSVLAWSYLGKVKHVEAHHKQIYKHLGHPTTSGQMMKQS